MGIYEAIDGQIRQDFDLTNFVNSKKRMFATKNRIIKLKRQLDGIVGFKFAFFG